MTDSFIAYADDGGKTWTASEVSYLDFGKDGFKAGGVGPNYAWDPISEIFYASSMGRDAFRFKR